MQTIQLTYKNDYAIAQLDRGKANPINRQMIHEITELANQIAKNDSVNGLILLGKEGYFSAGLDLSELIQLNKAGMTSFWKDFTQMMAILVSFPKPLIAAVTGHAPAGGCILAICADYRVMAEGNYKIGLNEVPVGIIVPKHIHSLYSFWIGERTAYQNLMEGKMVNPDKALQMGLIDEVVHLTEVLTKAEEKLQHYLSFDGFTWRTTKRNLRSKLIAEMQHIDEKAFAATIDHWFSEEIQSNLNKILSSLKK
jgi:Delta3-Delta2-enoyl-CoA isomerase